MQERGYPVRVLHAPAGEANGYAPSLLRDEGFGTSLTALTELRGTIGSRRAFNAERAVHAPQGPPTNNPALAREIGSGLFKAVFTAEILACFRKSLEHSRSQKKRLRIRLRIEAPELAALPWEFLYDEAAGDHVSLLRETALIRYLEMGRTSETLTLQPPLRILGMVASPSDLATLDVEREKGLIRIALAPLIEAHQIEIAWVDGQSWRDLDRALQGGVWHIFHFIGHGDFDEQSGEGRIALSDESSGRMNLLRATQLGRLFSNHPSLRLAVLNACEGARPSEGRIFSSTGAILALRGIPAVVSMQYEITDKAAIEFARGLYDAIARQLPVDAAVQEARIAMSMAEADGTEWATPVLYLRSPDGKLFNLDISSAIFPPSSEPAPFKKDAGETADARAASSEDLRGLAFLRNRVRHYWIDGVLEQSLFQAILLDLDLARLRDAVDNPWTSILERTGAESTALPVGKRLADVFKEEGSLLLILGEPGAGKTTSMLDLARDLLAQSAANPALPVPAIFNLSSWVEPYSTLRDWLADQLSSLYQIPLKIGRSWLGQSRILPLLDGLDELGSLRRAACVTAINTFTQEAGPVGTVVCCRLQEYIDLTAKLSLNAAVRILPLSDEQVGRYLEGAGNALAGLRELLRRDSAMRIEARSPLMLSLMSRAYQDLPASQLLGERAGDAAARRAQLMEAYIARMFRRAAKRADS